MKKKLEIFDLNIGIEKLNDFCYLMYGEHLIDKHNLSFVDMRLTVPQIYEEFWLRLKNYHIIVKNITMDDSSTRFDRANDYLKNFRDKKIQFSIYQNANGLSELKSVSPPLYNFIINNNLFIPITLLKQ